jgi:hypothetical protein
MLVSHEHPNRAVCALGTPIVFADCTPEYRPARYSTRASLDDGRRAD